MTIGNFDGVHCGHQQLFARVVEKAQKRGGTSVAITFDPHPLQILMPGGIKLISTCEQKIELIEMAGIDVLLIIPFTQEYAKIGRNLNKPVVLHMCGHLKNILSFYSD